MSIIDQIFDAGIVGCGGAGFPTHVKLKGAIEHLIINGAECEPLLRTDRYVMRNFAGEIVGTAGALAKELNIPACTIALKKGYTAEIAALRKAIDKLQSPVVLHLMDSFYLAGDEQTIVYEVTGRAVPPAGIPLDVGCAVSNAATILAISDAMKGVPFTHKYLTVTGEVKSPAILRVPVGTPLTECIALAGGPKGLGYCVLLGGPMMGKIISREEAESAAVTKTMSGIVLLPAEHRLHELQQLSVERMVTRAKAACIRCRMCTDLCPRHLLGHPIEPHRVMRRMALAGSLESIPADDPALKNALLCCECGVCELVACPMGLQPRRINAAVKKMLGQKGVRYQKGDGQTQVSPLRPDRKPGAQRAAARAGVLQYHHYQIDRFVAAQSHRVNLGLNMQIGAPCEVIVKPGDKVAEGQLIARCPEGKLGANLHASISGIVESVDNGILISDGGRTGE